MCLFCRGEDLSNLTEINCFSCQTLEFLPKLPKGLKKLDCSSCYNLTLLSDLPQSLEILYCYCCPLTFLPKLPKNLLELDCARTQVTVLPALPKNLKLLWCSCCPLKFIPALPKTLEILRCSYSENLSYIPKLPDSLKLLYCVSCPKLYSLEFESVIPPNLEDLSCKNTRISKIPKHPTAEIECKDCPWLDQYLLEKQRFSDLIKLQRFIKRFLFRRRVRIFSLFRNVFPKDICSLISKS